MIAASGRQRTLKRPRLEVADVMRRYGAAYRAGFARRLSVEQDRAMRELAACRTAAMGGHVEKCSGCGEKRPAYNPCRNRHCPKCQALVRRAWYTERADELLPVEYFHVVFTLPDELARLARTHPLLVYSLLCRLAAQALLEVGLKWDGLGAKMGFVLVLHTWGQVLNLHPHVHIIIPAGGLSADGTCWKSLPRGVFLPKGWIERLFRKKYTRALARAFAKGELEGAALWDSKEAFERWLDRLARRRWVVHVTSAHKETEPTDRTAAERILKYLARYAGGVALSDRRLVSIDDGWVRFWYKDYREGGKSKLKKMEAEEFLDAFLSHVLPRGMRHIRYYGYMASRNRTEKLQLIRRLLGVPEVEPRGESAERCEPQEEPGGDDDKADGGKCPVCGRGRMVRLWRVERPTVAEIMQMPLEALGFAKPARLEQLLLPLEFT